MSVGTQLQSSEETPKDDWDVFEEFDKLDDIVGLAKDHPECDMRKYLDKALVTTVKSVFFRALINELKIRLNNGHVSLPICIIKVKWQ